MADRISEIRVTCDSLTWRATYVGELLAPVKDGASCPVTEEHVTSYLARFEAIDRHVMADGSIRAGLWAFSFEGELLDSALLVEESNDQGAAPSTDELLDLIEWEAA